MPARLPYREELFAHEVAAFTPPDRAYMLAGFKSRPEFARGNACRLLRKPAVAQRIDELRADFRERCALNVEYLQSLLLPIVEANVLDCFEQASATEPRSRKVSRAKAKKDLSSADDRLRFKALARLRREQGLAIAGVKLGEDGTVVDLKFHSKTDAARTLLATLGIKEGDENAGLALVELGTRLGTALARANGGKEIEAVSKDPPLAPRVIEAADQDDIVSGEIEA